MWGCPPRIPIPPTADSWGTQDSRGQGDPHLELQQDLLIAPWGCRGAPLPGDVGVSPTYSPSPCCGFWGTQDSRGQGDPHLELQQDLLVAPWGCRGAPLPGDVGVSPTYSLSPYCRFLGHAGLKRPGRSPPWAPAGFVSPTMGVQGCSPAGGCGGVPHVFSFPPPRYGEGDKGGWG
jgi:hypothetical protein